MAALTKNKDAGIQEPKTLDYPQAASSNIYAGALTCVNASNYAVKAADTSGLKFVGIASDRYDNSSGAAGAKFVVVHRDYVARLAYTGTLAVGDSCYVLDDQTVTDATTAANDVRVGQVIRVDSGFVMVDLRK